MCAPQQGASVHWHLTDAKQPIFLLQLGSGCRRLWIYLLYSGVVSFVSDILQWCMKQCRKIFDFLANSTSTPLTWSFHAGACWNFRTKTISVFEQLKINFVFTRRHWKLTYRVTQKDVYPWKFQLWLWLKIYLFQITTTHYSVYGRPFTRVSTISVDF